MAHGRSLLDRTFGAALFADISGFTPLTEALAAELGRRRGAEELTRQLNAVYNALTERVKQYGGSIISFSGDAITCWFDRDDGLQAIACAQAIQRVMREFAAVQTPGGKTVSLAIKVAITTGTVRRFVVGDPAIQLVDILAGATLDHMAAAEKHAEKGEIVIGPEALPQVEKYIQVAEWRLDEKSGQRYAVLDMLLIPITLSSPWPELPDDALTAEEIRPWLLPPVYERLRQGQGQFLAELRPAVTLFMRFAGLDYDQDAAAGEKLDAYIRWVQQVLARYEGYMLQITVGDKGSYLYAAYGAPIAHGDDTLRAVAAAMELRTPPPEFAYITNIQIGISQGRMRTGAYGGTVRRTYGVLGDEVNTSARLMGVAKAGQVLVSSHVATAVARHYDCRSLGAFQLKGKKEPMPVHEVVERRQPSMQRPSTLFTHSLVGREEDLAQLHAWIQPTLHGQGQVIRVEGVAGIGKSHLVAELGDQAIRDGFRLVVGTCQSTNQGTPYYPWQQIFRIYFGLHTEPATGDPGGQVNAQIAQVEAHLNSINPEWSLRLPLLGDVLGLPIPENNVTASFDPRLRQESLFSLAIDLLQRWTAERPLLMLIEDAQWLDEASAGLTLTLARATATLPLVLLVVHRPPLQANRPILPDLDTLPTAHALNLNELSLTGVAALVTHRLNGQPTPLTLELIQAQAQGNPFFVEELVDALREAGHLYLNVEDNTWRLADSIFNALRRANCLIKRDGEWSLDANISLSVADLGIPDSIHGIVLSRLDRLGEDEKLTLKVASVIGRTFGILLLNHSHPTHPTLMVLQQQINDIETRDFVRLEIPAPQLAYLFKHSTTHEVSYETLLFAQRRELHRVVAEWYEQNYDDGLHTLDSTLAPHYPLLAYHWRQAENWDKERLYARLSGEQAASRFANEEAVAYLTRALELTPKQELRERYALVLAREAVYHLSGQRNEQAQDLIQLQGLADTIGDEHIQAEVTLRFAAYYEAMSDFGSAQMIAQQAVYWAEQVADPRKKVEGLIAWGMALWRRGKVEAAMPHLSGALALARQEHNLPGEAMSLHHLGTAYYYTGGYDKARTHLEQALTIRREQGDLMGEAGSLNNLVGILYALSDYGQARQYCEQALAIYQAIGYRRNQATALYNLASILYNTLGDLQTARTYLEQSLAISRALGNKQGECDASMNLGLVLYDLGQMEKARKTITSALEIAQAIGDKVSEGYSLSYLGLVYEALQELEEAGTVYEKAMLIRRQLGQEALTVDDLAGLSRVRLGQGRLAEAREKLEQGLAWMEQNGVDGVEYPIRVYLTGVDVWLAVGETAVAHDLLLTAYDLLQARAVRIADKETREAYLYQVPLHRELQARIAQREETKT